MLVGCGVARSWLYEPVAEAVSLVGCGIAWSRLYELVAEAVSLVGCGIAWSRLYEPVAETADRFDAVLSEFGSQVTHIDIHHIGFRVGVVAPGVAE